MPPYASEEIEDEVYAGFCNETGGTLTLYLVEVLE
jgi:hypothetical protein